MERAETHLQKLREENKELKKALIFLMNQELIKKLAEALKRINNSEYFSEEEFFSHSHR